MTEPMPELGCACATVRRAARLVTQLYSQEIGPELEPGQYSLLSALSQHPGLNQARLGDALGLDKTTISRNLRLMKAKGWISTTHSSDRRERGCRLTDEGQKLLAATRGDWERAQQRLKSALPPGEWENLFAAFRRVAEVSRELNDEAL